MTLVESLARAIKRSDNRGPKWPNVVEDSVIRQDMEYVLDEIGSDAEVAAVRLDAERQIQSMLWG